MQLNERTHPRARHVASLHRGLVEQVRRTEGRVVEMAALSSLFASHVQSQAQQIERLYTEATLNPKP